VLARIGIVCLGFTLGMLAVAPGWAENGDFSGQVKKPVREAIDTRQTTQKAEEKWRNEKQKLVALYEQLQQEQNRLQTQKDQLQHEIAAARERTALKEKQLKDMEQISIQITPFLQELVVRLRQVISSDKPFLMAERGQRTERLIRLMEDPEVSVSEKFRKAMEALMVEAEYGNTIEVYQETIDVDNAASLVNIFRMGRISLFYQTLDQKRCGFYDVAAAGWRPLPTTFNRSLQAAIEIGAKRQPVTLLTLPLGRMANR
jgi:Skp family chaperone for outer membrane proteins